MSISIVIPNYNGKALLEKNIPLLWNVDLGRYDCREIIIADDASTDDSISFVKKLALSIKSPRIKLVTHAYNQGFSSTVNDGVKRATGNIIILLNSDVYPEHDFLKQALTRFDDPKTFAVGFVDKSIENETILRGRGIGWWERGIVVHKKGETDSEDTFWVSAGSGAFRKSIWDILGGLDRLYDPFYWEDIDLSYRARKSGYRIFIEPTSRVVHEHTKGAIKSHISNTVVKTIAYRNQFIFVWKNITDRNLLISHFMWLPYHFMKQFLHFDTAFFSGFFQAVLLLGDILKRRKIQKKLYKLDDSALFYSPEVK